MTSAYIEVVDWQKFQHYKDRDPPWVKLYRTLLDNYEYSRLQDASKAHLVGLWLLAGRHQNRIPHDAEWIAKRIGATSLVDLQPLVDAGFIVLHATCEQDASSALAKRSLEERRGERDSSSSSGARARETNGLQVQESGMRARFDMDDSISVGEFLDAVDPSARGRWVAQLDAWSDGRGVPPVPQITPGDVAGGLRDFLTENPDPGRPKPNHVMGYVRNVAQRRIEPPPARPTPNGSHAVTRDAAALEELRLVQREIGKAGGVQHMPRSVYESLSPGGKAAWREVGGGRAIQDCTARELPFMERRWCQAWRSVPAEEAVTG